MAPKKKIKDFYYGSPINNAKHGFMTFNMVDIYVQKKIPKFRTMSKKCKIVM